MDSFVIRKNPKPVSTKSPLNIYTDGACSNNGKSTAKAGFGVWFGDNDERNTSQSYRGRQTNNVAELLAIVTALSIVKEDIEEGQIIHLYTDSVYSKRCCTTYGEKMCKKGWMNKGQDIPNREIVESAYDFCRKYPNIKFHHIAAHTGLQDEHSIGNDHADRLANLAIGVESCPYSKSKGKLYLNIPYSEKDEAKKLGAKWDSKKKKWFIDNKNKHRIQMMGRWGE
jgi:ribonuclease HI